MARSLSVNVGLPRDIQWKGRTVPTGIWKHPVQGRCGVRRLNLAGDGQGDLAGHGGEQRAVFVYQIDSYRYWQQQLKRPGFLDPQSFGQCGENFTVEGLAKMQSASATGIASVRRFLRSANRALPVIALAFG